MFYCKLCGPLSRIFLDEDDLYGHLNAQHRNWLSRNDYTLIIGQTEEDIVNESNEWKTNVSKRRPWYADPNYRGPKTMLERVLARKEGQNEPTESSKQYYEREIDSKREKIEKLEGLLKMKTELAENALHVASKAVQKNEQNRPRINWNMEYNNETLKSTGEAHKSTSRHNEEIDNSTHVDPLQHLFEGIEIRIQAAVDNAKTLRRTCEWKSKQGNHIEEPFYKYGAQKDDFSQTGF